MRIIKALMLAAIGLIVITLASTPAFAWYWPILGFSGPAQGSPIVGGPATILPGTPEWALQPSCGAQLVPIGYPYGVIRGNLHFGGMGCIG